MAQQDPRLQTLLQAVLGQLNRHELNWHELEQRLDQLEQRTSWSLSLSKLSSRLLEGGPAKVPSGDLHNGAHSKSPAQSEVEHRLWRRVEQRRLERCFPGCAAASLPSNEQVGCCGCSSCC